MIISWILGAGFNYNYPFNKNSAAFVRGNFNQHNNFSTSEFDIDVLSAETGYALIRENVRLINVRPLSAR